MSTVIATVTHKEYEIPADPLYIPLMAGAALMREVPYGYVRDDTGDNISASNAAYCELTGLYWAWKNLDADNIGLCHYRRYFASKASRKQILCLEEAEELLKQFRVILPKPRRYFIETNYSQYIHAHHSQDLDISRQIIAERYPGYVSSFDRVMKKRSGHRFNMLIMRRDLLDDYCSWLFDILFELEKRLDISEYSASEKRVFGYVAERLLDVWLDAGEIDYTELPYIMTERENLPRKAAGLIMRKLRATFRKTGKTSL